MMVSKELVKKAMSIYYKANFLVNDLFQGEYASAFKGSGIDFDTVKEYQVGDEIRSIDWNVTARMGRPYVKSFREERELTIMIMIDVSGSNLFGSCKARKMDAAAEVAAVLAFAAIKNNDKVGAIIFSDRIEKFLPPKKGKSHIFRVIRDIMEIQPVGYTTDISEAVEFFMKTSRKKVGAFLISDFIASRFEKSIKIAAKKHDIIAVRITDPRELEIPPAGILELFDPETGETMLVDTFRKGFRKEFGAAARKRSDAVSGFFRSIGVDFVDLGADRDVIKPLANLFVARSKRNRSLHR